jgi:uncharacterized protein (DUF2249 family)
MRYTRIIDLRGMSFWDREHEVGHAIGFARMGEAVTVIEDHDPAPLIESFAIAGPSPFRLRYLERGPRKWAVRIEPPPTAA